MPLYRLGLLEVGEYVIASTGGDKLPIISSKLNMYLPNYMVESSKGGLSLGDNEVLYFLSVEPGWVSRDRPQRFKAHIYSIL